jgi:hypothetical protein
MGDERECVMRFLRAAQFVQGEGAAQVERRIVGTEVEEQGGGVGKILPVGEITARRARYRAGVSGHGALAGVGKGGLTVR